jgi:glycosyltransferase involved in cell wall biosynthesis
MDSHYAGARVFINTSDTEGFPNSYLQSWIRGTPVVAFFDPDGVIQRERLGFAVSSLEDMQNHVCALVSDTCLWAQTSARCQHYMASRYAEERIVAPYLRMFEEVTA